MKTTRHLAIILAAAALAAAPSCSDDDNTLRQALAAPGVEQTSAAYNTLRFNWQPVPNTTQYGYKLTDPDGTTAKAGVTKTTTIKITGLRPSTTYTLRVWAFAGLDTDYDTSPAAEITATTAPIVKLDAPRPQAATDGGKTTITWAPVAGAQAYTYTITDANGITVAEGTLGPDATQYTPKKLDIGDYTFTITATTQQGGYQPSDPAAVTFHVDRTILYQVQGTYTSVGTHTNTTRTMTAYSDGTYSILAFRGTEGYNFDFAVETDGNITMLSGKEQGDASFKYWEVPTGDPADPSYYIYPWDGYCTFSGNQTAGQLTIGNYYGDDWEWATDTYTWETEGALTVDDITGTYTNHAQGITYFNDDWTEETFDNPALTATITKIDETTVEIDGLYYEDNPVTGTFDPDARTITIQPQAYYDYYTFASEDGETTPVIAAIAEDGTITIPYFCLWYDTYWYLWCKNTLTR